MSWYWPDYVHTNYSHWFRNTRAFSITGNEEAQNAKLKAIIEKQKEREEELYKVLDTEDPSVFFESLGKLSLSGKSLSVAIGKAKRMFRTPNQLLTEAELKAAQEAGLRLKTKKTVESTMANFQNYSKDKAALFADMENVSDNFEYLINFAREAEKSIDRGDTTAKAQLRKMINEYDNINKFLNSHYKSSKGSSSERLENERYSAANLAYEYFKKNVAMTIGLLTEYASSFAWQKMAPMLEVSQTGMEISTHNNRMGKRDIKAAIGKFEFGISVTATSKSQMEKGGFGVQLHHSNPLSGISNMVNDQSSVNPKVIERMIWFIINYLKLRTSGSIGGNPNVLRGSLQQQPNYQAYVGGPLQMMASIFMGESLEAGMVKNGSMQNDFLMLKDVVYPKSYIMETILDQQKQMKLYLQLGSVSLSQSAAEAFDTNKKNAYAAMDKNEQNREAKFYSENRNEKWYSEVYNDLVKTKTTISIRGADISNFITGG